MGDKYLTKMFSLAGRSCIVTGGGTGIGVVLAEGLARSGGSVVIAGRRKHTLDEAVDKIQKRLENDGVNEQRVFAVSCNLNDLAAIPNLVSESAALTGIPPTILINNAGVNVRLPAADLTADHWRISLDLMLTAPFMLAREMSNNMKEAKYGRIVTIASLQSYQAFPNSIPYATAKSGILGLTRALSEAYSPCNGYDGVTANAIAPGFVKTDLTEVVFADVARAQRLADKTILGRNSEAEDLVGTCVYLSSPASSYVTGQTILVDGGFTSLGIR